MFSNKYENTHQVAIKGTPHGKKKRHNARHMENNSYCGGESTFTGNNWHELSCLAQERSGWRIFIDNYAPAGVKRIT